MEFSKQVLLCSRGLPIALEVMHRLLYEGYDPNQMGMTPQPEQKQPSTLGKIAKWGGLGLGAAALGALGYGAMNPEAFHSAGEAVGNFANNHGMSGVGDAIKNAGNTAQEWAQAGHDKWHQTFDTPGEYEKYQAAKNPVADATNGSTQGVTPAPSGGMASGGALHQAEDQATAKAVATPPPPNAGMASGGALHQAEDQMNARSIAASDESERMRTSGSPEQRMQSMRAQQTIDQQNQRSLANSDQLEQQRLNNTRAQQAPAMERSLNASEESERMRTSGSPEQRMQSMQAQQTINQQNQQSLNNSDTLEQQRQANFQRSQQDFTRNQAEMRSNTADEQRFNAGQTAVQPKVPPPAPTPQTQPDQLKAPAPVKDVSTPQVQPKAPTPVTNPTPQPEQLKAPIPQPQGGTSSNPRLGGRGQQLVV